MLLPTEFLKHWRILILHKTLLPFDPTTFSLDFKKKIDAAVYLQLKNICQYTMKSERQNENNFLFLYLKLLLFEI